MARALRQAAVIPYRIRKNRVEIALVTTLSGKRWIVPKGSVDDGERPRDAATREAEEEAGLLGVVTRKPLGRYRYENDDVTCRVDVYAMRVTTALDRWDEHKLRRRRWVRVDDAEERLREELLPFLHTIERAARRNARALHARGSHRLSATPAKTRKSVI
jgi:8-oxo-dGTP pyrophosphatase MutT (NUDIX family)